MNVFPDVYFRPVQQRMNTNVGPWIKIGFKLVPQLRWLILKVPLEVFVARREVPLLGTGSFLVTPNPNDYRLVILFFDDGLQSIFLQQAATLDPRDLAVGESFTPLQDRAILANDQIQSPFLSQAIPESDHFRNFVTGVDMHTGNGHMTKESFSQKPKHHARIFADAPKHRQSLKLAIGLPQYVNALVLERIEMSVPGFHG